MNTNNTKEYLKPLSSSIDNGLSIAPAGMASQPELRFPKGAVLFCLLLSSAFILFTGKVYAYTASWYGITGDNCDPWKHTKTANGEKFNESALTAASWKYRLGSYVKVTNLRNHKSIIVRINDRGPGKHLYRKGRIIDLTRASFARIAKLSDGVVPVRVCLIRN